MPVDLTRSARMAAAMRAARTLTGDSQETVASKIGVDLKTIQRIESGKRHNPNLETIHALADLYGKPLDVLTGRVATPTSGYKLRPLSELLRAEDKSPFEPVLAVLESMQDRLETQIEKLAATVGETNLGLAATNALIATIAKALPANAPQQPASKHGRKAS